ncbi:MAG: carboxymuconolactone decarboxylase family protein [Actinomycetota bacterium]|nr:carboxymuconolactone decarboxylase family protein [Actinomycetota bacterium]
MANVNLEARSQGLVARLTRWYSQRMFGHVVEPARAVALHRGVAVAFGATETSATKMWNRLDPHLSHLAIQACAGAIGCSWCIDFGHFEGIEKGIDPIKVRDVPRWRESSAYDERERAVLEYAESASATPAVVSEVLVERLHRFFSDEELVELAAWVGLENLRSRFNAGLGIQSEAFSDRCDVRPLSTSRRG